MRLFEGTEFDRPPRCEQCGELDSICVCPPPVVPAVAPEKQVARIRLEKRQKGKSVTVIRDLDPTAKHLSELLTQLKNQCGAGGTIQGENLEIQGDHRERITRFLREQGYSIGQ